MPKQTVAPAVVVEPIDHDRLFKELLTTFFVEFLALFFPQLHAMLDLNTLEFLDKEVITDVTKGETYIADIVVKVRYKNSTQNAYIIIHVENQSKVQGQFPKRMFIYIARFIEKYDVPVYPIAVLSFDKPLRAEPNDYVIDFPDGEVLRFRFRTVQLNRLNWRDFVNRPNPVAAALMAKMKLAKADRPYVKLECLRLLATLKLNPAKMRLISGFVDSYLKLNSQETAVFTQAAETQLSAEEKETTMEIMTSWKAEGIEEGIEEGLRRGREEARQTALQFVERLAAGRIGVVDDELRASLETLTTEQMQDLGVALLRFETREEVMAWIDAATK